jgi:methyltransferase (TIGR00027 family)
MAVSAIRAVYSELPDPFGCGPDPLATSVLPFPFLIPSYLVALVEASPKASVALHRAYGSISFGLTYHVALRTRALDDALRTSLKTGTKQIVLLGAGLDGRAFRMPELEGLRVYEVDHPSTQRDKRERLSKKNVHRMADVVFVPVDFEHDKLDTSLVDAGFSRNQPSFWMWEGVTAYLTPESVRLTLQAIAQLSAPGSRVAVTYAQPPSSGADVTRPVVYRVARALVHTGSIILDKMGEAVRGLTKSSSLAAWAQEAGFTVLSDENVADWAKRYWPGEPYGPFEWERIAVLERAG